MSIEYISGVVARIIKKYGQADPYRLCRDLRILLLEPGLGSQPGACKGFFLYQARQQVITVNSDLPEQLQRLILAHEIGHAVLHREAAGLSAFHDFALFDETSHYEYQANIFAAELLLSDDVVLGLLNEDMSFFAAASLLGIPAELLDFKFRILKRKGYQVIDPPLLAQANFLKKV